MLFWHSLNSLNRSGGGLDSGLAFISITFSANNGHSTFFFLKSIVVGSIQREKPAACIWWSTQDKYKNKLYIFEAIFLLFINTCESNVLIYSCIWLNIFTELLLYKRRNIIKQNDPPLHASLSFSCDIKIIWSFKTSPKTSGAKGCWMNPNAGSARTDSSVKGKGS